MKSLDKAKQRPKATPASKSLFLLAVIFPFLFSFECRAQKLIINTVDGKVNVQDTAMLGRLIRYEAYIYNGLFQRQIPDSLPVIINLYKSRSNFIKARDASNVAVTKTGFYLPRTQECYVYTGDFYQDVIVHEISHRFMHFHNYYGVPHWINEGLAEFFEGLYMNEKNAIYVNPQSGRLARVKDYINNDQLDISRLLSLTSNLNWNNKDGLTQRYDVAYSIVYYIIKTRPQYIRQILAGMQQGKDSFEALATCYGSYEEFERAYKQYYQ